MDFEIKRSPFFIFVLLVYKIPLGLLNLLKANHTSEPCVNTEFTSCPAWDHEILKIYSYQYLTFQSLRLVICSLTTLEFKI